MPKLTKKLIENLEPAEAEFCVWDTQVTGFGVRVRPGGGRSYVLFYRLGGGSGSSRLARPMAGTGWTRPVNERSRNFRMFEMGSTPRLRRSRTETR